MDADLRPQEATAAAARSAAATLAYSDGGSADAGQPALVCVHGWAAEGSFFAPQADALKHQMRVVRVDLPGHGRSAFTPPCSIDRTADVLAAWIETLNLSRVIVVGWSMGAMVLWRMLARADAALSARVIGMVSVDMAPRVFNTSDWALGMGPDSDMSRKLVDSMTQDWAAFAASFTPRVFAPGADAALLARYGRAFANADPHVMAAYWQSMADTDCRADVAAIKQPMIACYGAKSQLYSAATAQWIAAAAPHAAAVRFDHSGHAPHLEDSEAFNALLNDFAGAHSLADDPRTILAHIAEWAQRDKRSGEPYHSSNGE